MGYATAKCVDNKIYCIGGCNTDNYKLNTNYCYDTLTDTWSTKTVMTEAKRSSMSVLLDNKIYVVAGYTSSSSLANTLLCYDILTDTWSVKANMSVNRYEGVAEAYNGLIYILGGFNSSKLSQAYDPTSNTYTTLSSSSRDICYGSGCIINDNIYCFGVGSDVSQVIVYNITNNSWESKSGVSPKVSLRYSTCETYNGVCYVVGGCTNTSTTYHAYNQVYLP